MSKYFLVSKKYLENREIGLVGYPADIHSTVSRLSIIDMG
jgi:hypothetical protein